MNLQRFVRVFELLHRNCVRRPLSKVYLSKHDVSGTDSTHVLSLLVVVICLLIYII
jgi:hypothetical protein